MSKKGITEHRGVLLIFVLFLAFIIATTTAQEQDPEGFNVEWRLLRDGVGHFCYGIDVQNLNDTNQDFLLSSIFSNTSFNVEDIRNVVLSEWKALPQEFPTYDIRQVYYPLPLRQGCSNIPGNLTHYVCNESYINGSINKSVAQWKPTKLAMLKVALEKLRGGYGLINIPKFESKAKLDDFGKVETVNGTKLFKLCFDVPVSYSSSGKVAFIDMLTNVEYHPWWSANWAYCKNITINNTGVSTLTNFPAFINLTYVAGKMQNDWDDVRFVNDTCSGASNQVELDYDFVENSTNGEFHVRIPLLETPNVTIAMYYGNPRATPGANPTGVWDTDYISVLHMLDNTTKTLNDSTSYKNNATKIFQNQPIEADAWLYSGQDFDVLNDLATIGHSADFAFADGFTIEVLANPDNADTISRMIYHYDTGSGDGYHLGQHNVGAGNWRFAVFVAPVELNIYSNVAPTGNFQHIAGVRLANGSMHLYVDGVLQTQRNVLAGAIDSSDPVYVGANNAGSQYFGGLLDEVRISKTNRSTEWLNQTYQLIFDQANQVTYDTEESTLGTGYCGGTYIYGNWTIRTSNTCENETISLNGNLSIESGGNLSLVNVTLVVNGTADGEYNITVMSGGEFNLENSTVTSNSTAPFEYNFSVYGTVNLNDTIVEELYTDGLQISSSDVTIENSTVRFSEGNGLSLLDTSSDNRLYNNTINNNSLAGIFMNGSTGNTIDNNEIANNSIAIHFSWFSSYTGINETITDNTLSDNNITLAFNNTNTTIYNATLPSAVNWNVTLSHNSQVNFENVTHDRTAINVSDTSFLAVRWYLDIYSYDQDVTRPLPSVTIVGLDRNNNTEFIASSGNLSFYRETPREFEQNSTEYIWYNVYNITGTKADFVATTNFVGLSSNNATNLILWPAGGAPPEPPDEDDEVEGNATVSFMGGGGGSIAYARTLKIYTDLWDRYDLFINASYRKIIPFYVENGEDYKILVEVWSDSFYVQGYYNETDIVKPGEKKYFYLDVLAPNVNGSFGFSVELYVNNITLQETDIYITAGIGIDMCRLLLGISCVEFGDFLLEQTFFSVPNVLFIALLFLIPGSYYGLYKRYPPAWILLAIGLIILILYGGSISGAI